MSKPRQTTRAPENAAPRPPILEAHLERATLTDLDAADLDTVHIEGGSLSKQTGGPMCFNGVRVVQVDLSETKVRSLSWLDVECLRSQLSVAEWPEAKLTRVVVRDSRATGLRMEEAELDDVVFVGCHLDYACFAGTKFSRVRFEQCRLHDADFGAADLSGTTFAGCDLQGVTFMGATLTGVDICTSGGTDIRVEARDVRGLIVNGQQAAALAKLLGLVVRT